jgi:cell division protein FtsW (lipid II flippase)
MPIQSRPEITMIQLIAPLVVALIFITLCSLFREPNRQNFSALMIAGAGAAYLNGGLLGWEFAFCNVMTAVAYFGLKDFSRDRITTFNPPTFNSQSLFTNWSKPNVT